MTPTIKEQLEEILNEIDEGIESESENLKECREIGCSNSYGAGAAQGAKDVLEDMRDKLSKLLEAQP